MVYLCTRLWRFPLCIVLFCCVIALLNPYDVPTGPVLDPLYRLRNQKN